MSAEDLATTVARELAEERLYAQQRGRPTPIACSSSTSEYKIEPPSFAPEPTFSQPTQEALKSALPLEDAGLRGAGAIFLTRYGRGRSATSVASSSHSNYSSPSRSSFYVVSSSTL